MYQKEVLRIYTKTMAAIWKHSLFQDSPGLIKSRFAKIWQEKLASLTTNYQFNLYCSTAKMERHMISLIQSIRHKMIIFDDIDAASFGFQEFLNVFDKTTSQKISSRYTNKAWVGFHIMQSSKKHPRLEIGLRE